MKATNDLIKKFHQNRSSPSKLVEFYLQKAKIFQVDLKVRSIYSAFISLFHLFSLASVDYHKQIKMLSQGRMRLFKFSIKKFS
jgi:hypothetical protein